MAQTPPESCNPGVQMHTPSWQNLPLAAGQSAAEQQLATGMHAPRQGFNPLAQAHAPPRHAPPLPQSASAQHLLVGMHEVPHFLVPPLHCFFFLFFRFFLASVLFGTETAAIARLAANAPSAPRRDLCIDSVRSAESNRVPSKVIAFPVSRSPTTRT